GRAGLLRVVNHAKCAERAERRRHTRQIEHAKPDRFEHALLAAMVEVALLDARAQIELRPRHSILLAPVVAHLQVMTTVEIELPHVLAHRVTPYPAPRTVADVIKDLPVVH